MLSDATHKIIAGLATTAAAAAAAAKGLALRGNRRNRAMVLGQYSIGHLKYLRSIHLTPRA
jgi:hypothetical protein